MWKGKKTEKFIINKCLTVRKKIVLIYQT